MLRSLMAVAALPLIFGSACATQSSTDELAGETAADNVADGKADGAVDGAYTYFQVSADLRKCLSPVCGGYFMARVNRSTTVCANGSSAASCYVPQLDWTEAHLRDDQQAKLLDAASQDATSDGVRALVRGRFASKTYPGHGNLGRFVVTEAWVAETSAVSGGVFVRVRDGGVRCIAAPCASTIEKGLNISRSAMIAEIDWSPAGLSSNEIQGFVDDLFTPSGAIIAGDRYTVTEAGRHAKGRTATAAFHRLADPTATAP
ncbi:MAG: hypothetical protein JWO36_2113 [Myxococcales bacterium]|nr:hypothetical protein [Myxococcales bacterium]